MPNHPGKRLPRRRILAFEALATVAIVAEIWAAELYDLPNRLFGGPDTLTNVQEATTESVLVLLVGAALIWTTNRLLTRLEYLEGLLPICASCKRIRDDAAGGTWEPIERYIATRSAAEFTHTICDACEYRLYPELRDGEP